MRKKKKYIGAAGDYAKYEIAVIKALSKLLKKPYKKVIETVNLDQSLLDIISKNFDKKISVSNCAKQLKAAIIAKTAKTKTPLQAFVDILNKLPKKEQPKKYVLPLKFPATVSIGKVKKGTNYHTDKNSHNVKINVLSGVKPHKAKYYIVYSINSEKHVEYFDKLPLDRYKGIDRMLYVTRLTDKGTALIPVKDVKTDLPIKVVFK